jgi:hypothetical protein
MNIRKLLVIGGLLFISLAAASLVGCGPSSYLSSAFSYQGVLTDGGGSPVPDGSYQVAFRLYDNSSGGNEVYVLTQTVNTQGGLFSTVLWPPIEEMDDPLWVDLTVEGEHLPTRQRLYGAPYALSLVGGATVDGAIAKGSAVSATLNVLNTSTGIGLGVAQSSTSTDADSAIVGFNYNAGDDVPTLKLTNMVDTGRIIEGWNGDGTTNPWDDLEFSVRGNGDVNCDGSFVDTGGDYADMLPIAEAATPGDVLVIGPDGKMARSTTSYATNVAGIYSTFPGFIGGDPMNNLDEGDPEKLALMASLPSLLTDLKSERVPVALAGVVPCKVSAENGAIQPGDLLVTSDTPGHAMRADPLQVGDVEFYPPGTILGKAMESLDQGTGVILVLVSLN